MSYRSNFSACGTISFLLLCTLGCGYNQQSRFQMSFLPAAPRNLLPPPDLGEVPKVQPNLYLPETPRLLTAVPLPPPPGTRADGIAHRAEEHFQKGKKFYQMKEVERARGEFDSAIDLMLQASESGPADRQNHE